jgi:hypothetical protein
MFPSFIELVCHRDCTYTQVAFQFSTPAEMTDELAWAQSRPLVIAHRGLPGDQFGDDPPGSFLAALIPRERSRLSQFRAMFPGVGVCCDVGQAPNNIGMWRVTLFHDWTKAFGFQAFWFRWSQVGLATLGSIYAGDSPHISQCWLQGSRSSCWRVFETGRASPMFVTKRRALGFEW